MGWEYKVVEHSITSRWGSKRQAEEVVNFETRLNGFGGEDWEMISYESIPITGGFTGNVKGYAYLCLFKRPT